MRVSLALKLVVSTMKIVPIMRFANDLIVSVDRHVMTIVVVLMLFVERKNINLDAAVKQDRMAILTRSAVSL